MTIKSNCMSEITYIVFKWIILCACVISLSSCASKLDPISLPTESALAPVHSSLWQELELIRSNDWFYLLNDGTSALEWRIRAIDSSTESIDFQTFLWDLDTAGKLILQHIFTAAERGVRVRLLIDDTFLLGSNNITESVMEHPNIEYRVFNPYKRRTDSYATREILNLGEFHRLNHRMHNKAMIVDNRVAIIGGRNIADEYFGLHASVNFRDMELLIGGPIALKISDGFDRYWNDHWSFPVSYLTSSPPTNDPIKYESSFKQETQQAKTKKWIDVVENAHDGMPVLLLDDPPPKDLSQWLPTQLSEKITNLIDGANEEILIVSAYLIPTQEFELAVKRAKLRGVDVRILTNSIRSNNHLTAHSAYRQHIYQILSNGAYLHETRIDAKNRHLYIQSPVENKLLALHAKVMTIDKDKVFIGSANFDPRSLRLNTEIGLLVHSQTLNQQVNDALSLDMRPENAWSLQISEKGEVQWVSDEEVLNHQPAHSFMRQIEDWFFSLLPIEDEM